MARVRFLARSSPRWILQGLADLEAHGEARVEARHRLLEDHRHLAADDLAELAGFADGE
jgi:hypothetical protein